MKLYSSMALEENCMYVTVSAQICMMYPQADIDAHVLKSCELGHTWMQKEDELPG